MIRFQRCNEAEMRSEQQGSQFDRKGLRQGIPWDKRNYAKPHAFIEQDIESKIRSRDIWEVSGHRLGVDGAVSRLLQLPKWEWFFGHAGFGRAELLWLGKTPAVDLRQTST